MDNLIIKDDGRHTIYSMGRDLKIYIPDSEYEKIFVQAGVTGIYLTVDQLDDLSDLINIIYSNDDSLTENGELI